MTAPIGLQLYSVRQALSQDFAGTVRQVAAMGYLGVETAGFPGTTPADARRLFDDLGLTVIAAHSPLPLGEKKNEVLDTLGALGCPYLVCAWLKPEEYFSTADQVRRAADLLNEGSEVARANGLTLVYHNHHFEYLPVAEGPLAYTLLKQHLAPEVMVEIDTYWVKVAGCDPIAVIREWGQRAPLLHIKDGPGVRGEPMTAVGEGIMDIPAVVAAGEGATRWLIVELDSCATDMLEAVERSYRYLVGRGLALGKA